MTSVATSFDPSAPFPASDPESVPYEEVKAHARKFDKWLGLELESVEAKIRSETSYSQSASAGDREFWLSKPVDTFMTPYWDLDHMLRKAEVVSGDLVIDLGAGYARLAFVLALRYPGVSFLGIEKIEPRLREAERVLATNLLFRKSDAAGFRFLPADLRDCDIASLVAEARHTHFFLYDFGSREDIQSVLLRLQDMARGQSISVLARGGRSREIIDRDHPWLSQVQTPRHFARFSIYRS